MGRLGGSRAPSEAPEPRTACSHLQSCSEVGGNPQTHLGVCQHAGCSCDKGVSQLCGCCFFLWVCEREKFRMLLSHVEIDFEVLFKKIMYLLGLRCAAQNL